MYALNRAGIDYIVGLPAFSNPSGVAPLEVEWDLEEVVVPLAGPPLVMPSPVFHVPAPGYSKEQATIGLAAFQTLTGRVNYFMENVVAGSSKVDENVALRLKNLDRVSTKMRDLPWVVNNKLLIALMTGNYRQERDTKIFLFFSLLDFCKEGRRWFDISSMWGDLMDAAGTLDVLLRAEGGETFVMLFEKARCALKLATDESTHEAAFVFQKTSMLQLWERFGLLVRQPDLLKSSDTSVVVALDNLFTFFGRNLKESMDTARTVMVDALLYREFDKPVYSSSSFGAPKRPADNSDFKIAKKPAGIQGSTNKKLCCNYLCFLAGAVKSHGGKKYTDCSQNYGCAKFSHLPVTKGTKEAARHMLQVLPFFTNDRVLREAFERYLATI